MEITQRDLLTFNGMIITGMLFFFGLSSDIPQKNLIVYGMAFPFLASIAVVIMILADKSLATTLALTQTSLAALFVVIAVVSIDVIILDNYISNNIIHSFKVKINGTI